MRTQWLRRRAIGALLLTTACAAWTQASGPAVVSSTERAAPSMREQHFALLVSERARAIELAFGETFAPHVQELRIVLVRSGKWATEHPIGDYDPESRTLYFAKHLQYEEAPTATAYTTQYWPWYDRSVRGNFPIVEIIDGALWTVVLKEAAREHELTWPHAACRSFDVAERLPCEMLLSGVAAYTTQTAAPLFNENRIADIWPEDLVEFRTRVRRGDDQAYLDARKYGGYLLLRPLVSKFGLPRTLSYVAGTPFRVEQNNVRLSAERYQRNAEEALAW
jgi:hypothetical protein